MDKIIFFHMNQLGDLLFSLPVLEAAKRKYPGAKIYSVARENLAGLLERTLLTDKIFIKKHSLYGRFDLIGLIRKEHINTSVLFSESPETLISAFMAKIPERVGFRTASLNFLLTDVSDKTGVPSLSNNIKLAEKIGLTDIKTDYTGIIKVPDEAEAKVLQWLRGNNIVKQKFVVISLGASARRREKCLPDDTWISVIDALHTLGVNIVAVCARWEKNALESILQKSSQKVTIFCPEGGLLETSALISQSSLFIGIDSGAMHLAAALGIKCVALYGKTDPLQIGPQPAQNHIIIKKDDIKNISVNDIIGEVRKILKI